MLHKYIIKENRFSLPVDDATGRYTSAYFDGNNYWMGSLTLCKNIFIEDIDRTIELGMQMIGNLIEIDASPFKWWRFYFQSTSPPKGKLVC